MLIWLLDIVSGPGIADAEASGHGQCFRAECNNLIANTNDGDAEAARHASLGYIVGIPGRAGQSNIEC